MRPLTKLSPRLPGALPTGRRATANRFLGILAHDVRSPLHLINLAASHLLIDGASKQNRIDDASRIRRVRRIKRRANDSGRPCAPACRIKRYRSQKPNSISGLFVKGIGRG